MANKVLARILETPTPEELKNKDNLNNLRGFIHTLEESNYKDVYVSKTWNGIGNIQQLREYLKKIGVDIEGVPNKYLGILVEHWYENLSLPPEYQATETEAPEYKEHTITEQPNPTTPGEIRTKEMVERQEAVAKSTRSEQIKKSNQAVQQAIDRKKILHQQEILRKNIAQAEDISKSTELKDKVVYATVSIPEIPPLEPKEKEAFETLRTAAIKDPKSLENDLEKIIVQKITPDLREKLSTEEITLMAKASATDIVERLNPPTTHVPMPVQTAILKEVYTDNQVVNKVVKTEKTREVLHNSSIALALHHNTDSNKVIADAILGPKLSQYIYYPVSVTLSAEKVEGYTQVVSLEDINKGAKDLRENQYQALDYLKDLGRDEAKKFILSKANTYLGAKLETLPISSQIESVIYSSPTIQGITYNLGYARAVNWEATNWVGQQVLNIYPEAAPYLNGVSEITGIGFGIRAATFTPLILTTEGTATIAGVTGYEAALTGISSYEAVTTMALPYAYTTTTFAGSQIAGQVITTTAATVAGEAGGAAAGTAAGVAAGAGGAEVGATAGAVAGGGTPLSIAFAAVGAAVGALFGKAVSKIQEKLPKIKKVIAENGPAVALGLIGGGLLFRSIPMIAGGLGLGAATFAYGGVGSIGAGIVGIGLWLRYLFRNLIGPSIIAPFIITLLVLPVLIAFIMFVINSGAYLVPPSPFSQSGKFSSPYVDLTKVPNPPGPFSNSEFPKEIVYTITVKPKKGPLNNVSLKYNCKVISEASIDCPSIEIIESEYKDIFSSTIDSISPTGITFSYRSTYDNNYVDSAVIDSIILSASTTEESNVNSEVSASVTFGTPPISCPVPGAKVASPQYNYSLNQSNNTGHGSQAYWQAMGQSPSAYALPQGSGCHSVNDCSYYGYAYDVFPTGTKEVFAPTVEGKDVTWACSYGFSNRNSGHTYICNGSGYTLVLTHMTNGAKTGTINSGEKIGTLFNQGDNTHLHIEFSINGRWQKPENYFCQ